MKCVIQRVKSSSVSVNSKIIAEIGIGLNILVGFSKNFDETKLDYMVKKISKLKLWSNEEKGFKKNIFDINGEILVISQFTLFGKVDSGTKPNFNNSLEFDKSKSAYEKFIFKLKSLGLNVEQGEFGSMMNVKIENDGPVTFILEK